MGKKRIPLTTAAQVRALKPEAVSYVHSMKGDRGLYVKVLPSGRKSWNYRYRVGARFEWLKLGDVKSGSEGMKLADARVELGVQRKIKTEHGSAKQYRDDERAKQLAALAASDVKVAHDGFTVEVMCQQYIEHASRDLKSWAEVDRALKKNVIAKIGSMPSRAVRRVDVIALLEPLNKKGKTTMANRTLSYLRRVFNWANNQGKFDTGQQESSDAVEFANPCQRIEMNEEKSKDRALSDTEIKRLLENLPKTEMTSTEQDLILFLLLSGVRLGEAASASYDQIDSEAKTLTLLNTKNSTTHIVPLNAWAFKLVEARKNGSQWLFPMANRPKQHIRADRLSTPLRESISALKVMTFTPHDLRRTFATGLARLKAPRLIISLALNHKVAGVTSIYDQHEYGDELREWFDRWGEQVELLAGRSTTNSPEKRKASA
jgi:integrase